LRLVARRVGSLAWLALVLCACTPETEYEMGEPIEMGPFTFVIEQAYERLSAFPNGDPRMEILVDLRLDAAAGAKVKLDEFLNDTAGDRGMIIHPHVEIRDKDGQSFMGWVRRLSGRQLWRAEFPLVDDAGGVESASLYLHRRAGDFRLVIDNPDRRSGQSSRAAVMLGPAS
jgi:hypothetical protein